MRLRQLRLEHYGCFEKADLNFVVEPGRINLISAPNGAGKSVLRQAFHDLLFDIPLQSPMKFRFGYTGMALHAEAVTEDGAPLAFGWVRGGKPPRVATDEARFAALRGGTSPRQLEQLFALDTARLRKGGTDLQGGESLAGALLSGTGELAGPRKLKAELDARRAANWSQGKSKPALNAALAALNETRKAVRATVQRPQHREQQEQALAAQREAHASARAALAAAQSETRRLFRIELTRPLLADLAEAEAWLVSHPDAPALPPGLEQPLAAAREGLVQAETGLRLAQAGLVAAEVAAAAIATDEAVVAEAEALAALPEALGKAEPAAADIVKVRAARDAAYQHVRAALRGIGADTAVEQAAAIVPPVALLTAARLQIAQHTKLHSARGDAAARAEAAARALRAAEVPPDEAAAAPDGLAALFDEVHADRKPQLHAAELEEAHQRAAARLRAAMAKLPGWSGPVQALQALTVPDEAVFERLYSDRETRAQAARDRLAECDALNKARVEVRRKIDALGEQPLPDDAAIAARRARRDAGWSLIFQRSFTPGGPDEAGERAYTAGDPLPLVFERDLRLADETADRRIAELDRVSAAERLALEDARLVAECAAAAESSTLAAADAARASRAWTACLAPLGLAGDAALAEVRRFIAGRQSVIEALSDLEVAEARLADLRSAHAAWADRLAALLGEAPREAALPSLLARAEACLQAAKAGADRLLVWKTNLTTARLAHQDAVRVHEAAEQALRDADAAWAGMLSRLQRPDGEPPAATASVLDLMAELETQTAQASAATERIDGMQDILDRFAAEVTRLSAALGEPAGTTPFVTARALIRRRDAAALSHSAWNQAQQTLAGQQAVLEAARAAMVKAELARNAVVAAAGASDVLDAEARIFAAREHSRFAAQRDSALAGLTAHGGGETRETLRAQADALPASELQAARATADEREREAAGRVVSEAVALDALQKAFDADADTTMALDAVAAREAASATYARLLDEQLVLHLASVMLSRAMADIEGEMGDGGLARLSAGFSSITNGAYGVMLDEEDGTTLYAIEHRYPRERKRLDELSEGTRDQLYLALRLIALEEHARSAEPMPFIADDILQTFDDDRATAALTALVKLSERVQVIVLTHHAHLRALAAPFGEAVHHQVLA